MPASAMHCASSLVEQDDPHLAAATAAREVAAQLTAPCHLGVLFVSHRYQTDWAPILRQLRRDLGNPLLIGCSGGGILGGTAEMEETAALSLLAAHLPSVAPHPFTVSPDDLAEPQDPGFWIEKLGCPPAQAPIGILLPDPFTCDATRLVEQINAVYPRMPLIGGLASGADQAAGHQLFLNDQVLHEGAVGLLLTGDIALHTIVSQGCRPIGRPYIVTKAEGNVIAELAGLPATDALQQLFMTLPPRDKTLARRALFLGVVMREQQDQFARGDFLIRNLIGLDPSTGAMAIGDRIQVGQTVQFQLRDADTSREDLASLLKDQAAALAHPPAAGALLFSCLGRGQELYGEPHYDVRTIQAAIGRRPLAGFFCNGEIGPVGGRTFIHGFTSSLGLIRPRGSPAA